MLVLLIDIVDIKYSPFYGRDHGDLEETLLLFDHSWASRSSSLFHRAPQAHQRHGEQAPPRRRDRGILVFLMGDVWGDATNDNVQPVPLRVRVSPYYDGIFTAALCAGFLGLYYSEHRKKTGLDPSQTSLIIALGIGFQNLTEGLVFGALAGDDRPNGDCTGRAGGVHHAEHHRGLPHRLPVPGEVRRKGWEMAMLLPRRGSPDDPRRGSGILLQLRGLHGPLRRPRHRGNIATRSCPCSSRCSGTPTTRLGRVTYLGSSSASWSGSWST